MDRILIVDDESRWREKLPDFLQQHGLRGVQVDVAGTVDQAIEMLGANDYALVTIDGMGETGE